MGWAEFFGRIIGNLWVSDSFVSLNQELKEKHFRVERAHQAVQAIENKPKSKTAIEILKKIFINYIPQKGISKDLKEKINSLRSKALKTCNEMTEARQEKDFRRLTTLIQDIKDIIGPI